MFRMQFLTALLLAAGVFGTQAMATTTVSGPSALPMRSWGIPGRQPPARRAFPASWQMRASAKSERVLFSFTGPDGNTPNALIRDARGALYGTTNLGGSTSGTGCFLGGCGTVFQLTPPAAPRRLPWSENLLYTFSGPDGAQPLSALLLAGHNTLYGTTEGGGLGGSACGEFGCGTVFELRPPTRGQKMWTESVLYAFTGGNDGELPMFAESLIDVNGSLYGTTAYGGAFGGTFVGGTVFELTPGPSGWTESVIHSFGGASDGSTPYGGLLRVGRALYGTTSAGGNTSACGCGTVFELTPPARGQTAWTETVLYSFTGPDGWYPQAGLIADASGALYGTTADGGTGCSGSSGCGIVFKLTPPARGQTVWKERVLHDFTGTDGIYPESHLSADQLGNLYGTAAEGGTAGFGTVFKLAPPAPGRERWNVSVLHDFTGGADGGTPDFNNLIDDGSGTLFGETGYGGTTCPPYNIGCGVVFQLKERNRQN